MKALDQSRPARKGQAIRRQPPGAGFLTAFLILFAAAAFAAPPKELTPPVILGKANTIHVLAVRFQNDVEKEVSEAWLARPNKAYVEDTDRQIGGVTVRYVSDGRKQTEHCPAAGPDTHSAAPARIAQMKTHALALKMLLEFFTPAQFARFLPGPKTDAVAQYSRISQTKGKQPVWTILTVDRKTSLPIAVFLMSRPPAGLLNLNDDDEPKGRKKNNPQNQRIEFHYWELNTPINPRELVCAPPK